MKKLFLVFAVFTAMFAFTACDDNDALLPDEGDEYAGTLVLSDVADQSVMVYTSDVVGTEFDVMVTFKSTDKKMRRVYMTENIAGAGSEPYTLDIEDLDLKGDGSLDVESKQGDEFSFVLPFPVLSSMQQGTVEYQLWATNGRGDFRDSDNSLAVGLGTIVVNYGGSNPATAVKEYTAKLLAAPLADGSSGTFISILNGDTYKLSEGEEYASFWDFGYYYGGNDKASLSSPYNYPSLFNHDNDASTPLVAIATLTGTDQEALNHTYFAKSTKTSADFNAITNSSDLVFITASTSGTVTKLAVGDIIEFVDNYGKKGLIRVTNISGTWGSNDYIEFDIKLQP